MSNKQVGNSPIIETTDYDQFTILGGNRDIDKNHVKRMTKLLGEQGNLTGDFPIIVNKRMEVMDGQHRLAALKQLKWPVYYQVRENLSLSQVRAINVGHRNWTWLDFARSYANLGNKNYIRFLQVEAVYHYGYGTLAQFSGFKDNRSALGRSGLTFRNGGLHFSMEDQERTLANLSKWDDVREYIPRPTGQVAKAFHRILENPNYDHDRMIAKMEKFGKRVFNEAWVNLTMSDAARAFEEVYNFHAKEGAEVRLY